MSQCGAQSAGGIAKTFRYAAHPASHQVFLSWAYKRICARTSADWLQAQLMRALSPPGRWGSACAFAQEPAHCSHFAAQPCKRKGWDIISTASVDSAFAALSDRTRRDLLTEIVRRNATTATDMAADRSMSRQGVSGHLAVLASAGLVERRRAGRYVFYRANAAGLFAALSWIVDLGADVAKYQDA